jgi:hypothetical protein
MEFLYNPIFYVILIGLFIFISRTLNQCLFKNVVKRTFEDIMKAGFGVETSLRVIKGIHGQEGVDLCKKNMEIPNCTHARLANREIHDFDPNKLKYALEHFPQAPLGPTEEQPCYCVACGKLFTNLNDFKSVGP